MQRFLAWFESDLTLDPVLKAGIAHLWFVTIHPFEDGNGRMARAITDMSLARSERSPQRFYSMSGQIQRDRADYYDILEATQKGGHDITAWLAWFLERLDHAFDGAEDSLRTVMTKAKFWTALHGEALNDRQRLVLNRMLDGFEGKLTSSKWATLAKTSQDTALRDIEDLVRRRIVIKEPGGGRSTSYALIASRSSPCRAIHERARPSLGL